jgi:hypothetical protein
MKGYRLNVHEAKIPNAYAGAMTHLELNMKYDDFLIVKGLMLTAR